MYNHHSVQSAEAIGGDLPWEKAPKGRLPCVSSVKRKTPLTTIAEEGKTRREGWKGENGKRGSQSAFLRKCSAQRGTRTHHEPPKGHRFSQGMPDVPCGLAGALTRNEPSEKSVWVVRMNAARPETQKSVRSGVNSGWSGHTCFSSVFHQNYF